MFPSPRLVRRSLLTLGLALLGCDQGSTPSVAPQAPSSAGTTPSAVSSAAPASASAPEEPRPAKREEETPSKGGITLEKVTHEEFLKRMAATKGKLTLVDAWATWCAPCKENFPHVVEMHEKYAGKGLAVASLSLDQPDDTKQVAEARAFLNEKKANFPNYLLNEEQGDAFDKLNINGIPAVFVFDGNGKEVRRYTMDDTKHQFTYEQVEKDVVAMLEGKSPAPEAGKGEPSAASRESK